MMFFGLPEVKLLPNPACAPLATSHMAMFGRDCENDMERVFRLLKAQSKAQTRVEGAS